MNIFYLHENPIECSKLLVDKHVVKMVLEYAQLLCTVHFLCGNKNELLYKPTHVKHPCVLWLMKSNKHYLYVYELFIATANEYTHRYGKIHTSYTKLHEILSHIPIELPQNIWINPPCAMPQEYIVESTIESYKNYYKYGKTHLIKYTNRHQPEWLGV